jgi:RNA polymerase sigma-70 factor (ECF subfamily)
VLTTSRSLLQRMRLPEPEPAWARFVELYTPLLLAWARKAGLSREDAEDHTQDVLALLALKLPDFTYDRSKGPFRGWLWRVFLNKLRDRIRRNQHRAAQASEADLAALTDGEAADPLSEAEHNQYLVRRALEVMQAEFEPTTWQACWKFVVDDLPAASVAEQLGITPNAVHIAKLRVLRHLRRELAEFLD